MQGRMRVGLRKGMASVVTLGLLFTFLSGCARKKHLPESEILLGGLSQERLLNGLPSWKEAFDEYQPDSAAVDVIRQVREPVEVLVFLGTWCPDSKREVPRFLKALTLAGNERIRAKYYGVPRGFREEDDAAIQYEIEAVPTFIVRVRGREVGRIVERAEAGIERDLAAILVQAGVVGGGE